MDFNSTSPVLGRDSHIIIELLCGRYGQTEPPTIPVDELFEEGSFPEGEILEHPRDFNSFRVRETRMRTNVISGVMIICLVVITALPVRFDRVLVGIIMPRPVCVSLDESTR